VFGKGVISGQASSTALASRQGTPSIAGTNIICACESSATVSIFANRPDRSAKLLRVRLQRTTRNSMKRPRWRRERTRREPLWTMSCSDCCFFRQCDVGQGLCSVQQRLRAQRCTSSASGFRRRARHHCRACTSARKNAFATFAATSIALLYSREAGPAVSQLGATYQVV
jgi:hypothetical protein